MAPWALGGEMLQKIRELILADWHAALCTLDAKWRRQAVLWPV